MSSGERDARTCCNDIPPHLAFLVYVCVFTGYIFIHIGDLGGYRLIELNEN